ncbi:TetR/AcrR family transcriptional regulator [Streptomyces sp. NA04227]|uniref:TetR/AcrR family transcriptional regulator n=1 Tax=Streptomyces sp. NA04227 TaxID=2742136 RepID=UPI001590A9B5|nr:TetR/AcrR family transcriptional regulator [Streptomyces sp. NA04227]QKW07585.1 TetR/AcrR family transcriptional regulator [Streptomyces sp. NA04227]
MPRPTSAELDAEIVETAARLFTERGYHGTSVQEIANRVGYSKTGLLHRFPSKEHLLLASLREPLAELAALRALWTGRPAGPRRAAQAAVDLVDLALRYRSRLSLLFDAGLPLLPDQLAALGIEGLGEHRDETLAALRHGRHGLESELRAQMAISGLMHTLAGRHRDTPADTLREPLLAAFMDVCRIDARYRQNDVRNGRRTENHNENQNAIHSVNHSENHSDIANDIEAGSRTS